MFENDGCTLFPDGAWVTCCNVHDEAFATGLTIAEFLQANADLYGCMAQYNWLAASIAFLGVMTGGSLFYFLGRKRPPGPLPSVIIANPSTASHLRDLFSASEKTMANNAERWDRARFTRSTPINAQAEKIAANLSRYELVSKATGVPWDVIGVIHYRESSGDFRGVLHNGQKIIGTGQKTTLVPQGRGPFSTWEDAAVDALVNCHPYMARNKDWSIGTTLDKLEAYNGLGYRNKGLASPYLWAGTDQYVKGKYVADGKFDPNHVDQQLGVAPILMRLRDMTAQKPVSPKPAPTPTVPLPKPAKGRGVPAGIIVTIIIIAAAVAAFLLIRQ